MLKDLNQMVGPYLKTDNVSMLSYHKVSIKRCRCLRNVLVIKMPLEQKYIR